MRTRRAEPRSPGRPKGKSGLPEPIPGQPFSLLGTLRRCTRMLTPQDVATLLQITVQAVYQQMDKGLIPEADLGGIKARRIDPAAWVLLLEHKNQHLRPSSRQFQ
ncbi:MAG: helix-turn-helix domain-containing protein, partial [Terriglobus sp.]